MTQPILFPVGLFLAIALWELAWKAFGLYYSAKNSQWGWFIPMLLFNTIGVLPMIYLFFARKDKNILQK